MTARRRVGVLSPSRARSGHAPAARRTRTSGTGAQRIAAVPTVYRGVQMRSKLEARWAGVLDAAGLAWAYEPQAFSLGRAGGYLPDFWLPEQRTWVEVKGPHMERLDKTRALARKLGKTGQVLLATAAGVCWRVPPSGRPSQLEAEVGRCGNCGQVALGLPERQGRLWCRNPACGRWAVPERTLGW